MSPLPEVPPLSRGNPSSGTPDAPVRAAGHLAAGIVYLAAGGVTLGGVLAAPLRRVVGAEDLHVWEQLWYFWWMKFSLTGLLSPLHTELINYPAGADVYALMPSLFPQLLSVPFQPLFGLVGTYNLVALGTLVLAACGAYLVCLRITRCQIESILGGLIFGFSPFLQTDLANGITEKVFGIALMPYFLLFLLRMNEDPSPRNSVPASLLLGFAVLSSWYCGILAVFLSALTFIFGWTGTGAGRRGPLLKGYGTVGFISLLIVAAPLVLLLSGPELNRALDWKTSVAGAFRNKACLDILQLFTYVRGESAAPGPGAVPMVPFGVYLGKIVLLLTAAALLIPNRTWRIWKVGLALFMFLSLGPYLNIGGRLTWGGFHVPLPNRLLLVLAPGLGRIFALHNYRFISMVMLFGGILATLALTRILGRTRIRPAARIAVVAALCWLTLVDFGHSTARRPALQLPVSETAIPGAYQSLRDAGPGALLDLPSSAGPLVKPSVAGKYLYYQTLHRHPVHSSTSDIEALKDENISLLREIQYFTPGRERSLNDRQLAEDWPRLVKRGFRFVAVHRAYLSSRDHGLLIDTLGRHLGDPLSDADGVTIFELPAGAESVPLSSGPAEGGGRP